MNIKTNCRRATMIIEKKEWGSIGLLQNLELAVHLSWCRDCKIYKVQSQQLSQLIREFILHSTPDVSTLDKSAKDRLRQRIDDELKK
ncbi:MAG: hypothetical protein ABI151_08595 [Chitinophagaceae bacterium]